jgi:D-aminopeptidase
MRLKSLLITAILCFLFLNLLIEAQGKRIRKYGISIGTLKPGQHNAITDVAGVEVGHRTVIKGESVRTGVTAILPHSGNIMQAKVPAAIYIANGFGKLTGYSQVEELGNIETPIVLTNTLSVPIAADALIDYTYNFDINRKTIRSINPVAGETNDGYLNDIQGRHITKEHVLEAIESAEGGTVQEGSLGAGTGTICFGYKGGIGTSSRVLPADDGGFTIGVLVQTNFGGDLKVAGIPVEKELEEMKEVDSKDGSCMVVVATDAPITYRNLRRLAKRATFGIARTGGHYSNGSGEYVIAFSTAEELRIPHQRGEQFLSKNNELRNDRMSPLFEAVIEATEEAILNSMFAARTMTGKGGRTVKSLPVKDVIKILQTHAIIRE